MTNADPYRGVPLGVECAWWPAAGGEARRGSLRSRLRKLIRFFRFAP
jgi:hypothetical protein